MIEENDTQGATPENEPVEEDTATEETSNDAAEADRIKQLEADVAKYKRMAQQKAKKAEKSDEPTEPKSGDLDYGQKAFLVANGIKGTEETKLVTEVMAHTGKSLDDVLESKYFQAELKEMREAKASAEAVPKGSKRSGQSARDTVEYWVAKGELPPADQQQLRRDVVNARLKAETQQSKFTSNPVVK